MPKFPVGFGWAGKLRGVRRPGRGESSGPGQTRVPGKAGVGGLPAGGPGWQAGAPYAGSQPVSPVATGPDGSLATAPPFATLPIRAWVVVLVVTAAVAAGVGAAVGALVAVGSQQTIVERFFPSSSALAKPTDVQAVLAKVLPAVVTVTAHDPASTSSGGAVTSSGTGMVISADGEVLTNAHLVAGASSVSVTLYGQSSPRASELVGVDLVRDVALLKVRGVHNLPTVTLGSSATIRVGDSVLAIGDAPGGSAGPVVTEGIISAKERSVVAQLPNLSAPVRMTGMIQTDAAIDAGNSGGPLVDTAGRVVGVSTAVTVSGSASGPTGDVGFAIPVDLVRQLLPSLRAESGVTVSPSPATNPPKQGYLGVDVVSMTGPLASQLHVSISVGALVVTALPGGPAATAGIQTNDVIVAIDGRPVDSAQSLSTVLSGYRSGDTVMVTVVRATGGLTRSVTLGSTP
ncbi:MAG: trypsin-like peptidase domain-containing protein [Actinomycetota bacterium]|nr:trypsin-like peptidase domain-containing protein [Actinomycetota bacterium]